MTKSVFLQVSSAFMVGGQIAKAGDIVEVSEGDAKDILHRGKATLATETDAHEQANQEQQSEPEQNAADDQPAKGSKGKKGK